VRDPYYEALYGEWEAEDIVDLGEVLETRPYERPRQISVTEAVERTAAQEARGPSLPDERALSGDPGQLSKGA